MYDTVSVFDNLEIDTTNHRVASRRALALAHKRVDERLGSFFRGAQSEEEFMERLGLVGEDFTGFVNTASAEVGHEHPEHIAAALIDMYKQAAQPPQFVDPEKEEEDAPEGEEADAKESSVNLTKPNGGWTILASEDEDGHWIEHAVKKPGELHRDLGVPQGEKIPEDKLEEAEHSKNKKVRERAQFAENVKKAGPMGVPMQYQTQDVPPTTDSESLPWEYQNQQALQNQQFYPQAEQAPQAPQQAPAMQQAQQMIQQNQAQPQQEEWPPVVDHAPPTPAYHGAANNPADQPEDRASEQGGQDHKVQCPECGGGGKTANNTTCPKCHGAGSVSNFGGSMTDAVGADLKTGSWTVIAEEGNGGFGGPEPVINKEHAFPSKDGLSDPAVSKDPVVPIVMKNRTESPLEEIGDIKSESLPSATGLDDSGFNTETPGGKGPHTKTFNGEGQTTPVTHETM